MRPEKESMLEELKQEVDESMFIILTDFSGMTMPTDRKLRGKLREVEANYRVVKTNLFRSMAEQNGMEDFKDALSGPTAMVSGSGDVSAVLKALKAFGKEHEFPTLKVGSVNGVFMTTRQLEQLADLPSREELLAKIVGSIAAPASGLVNTMHQAVSQLVNVLGRIEDQKREQEA